MTGSTVNCDFSDTGLTSDAKSMISESVWNLGAGADSVTTKEIYTLERGTMVSSGRPTKWTGKVGLIYPSDYGYATVGGSTTDRMTCLNTSLDSWKLVNNCYNNNWLLMGGQWTITPYDNGTSVYKISGTNSNMAGNVVGIGASQGRSNIIPVIYLDSKLGIEKENDGSSSSPFVLKS